MAKKIIMKNKNTLDFFQNMASNNPDEKSVKITKKSDFTQIDSNFILNYSNKNTEILDLASGSGLTVNKIFKKIKHITAVELFPEFSKFIKKSKKITIINKNISSFSTDKIFDLITMFGIVQYFNQNEIIKIYTKYKKNLKKNGLLIIKGQFGVKEDVVISGYSNELKTNYYSQYRHIKKEIKILNKIGYKNIEIIDIYPPECNRWKNTHFYAIVATK